MKTFWFQFLGLVIVILAASFFAFNSQYLMPISSQLRKSPLPQQTPTTNLQILRIVDPAGNTKAQLAVEIADDKQERNKGLGYRQSLASDSGMLFIHESVQKYTYWMKGMQFPIDIIWIRDDTILDIIPNIPPPIEGQSDDTLERYASTVEVNRVLETNAGFVSINNIQKGDKIVLESSN